MDGKKIIYHYWNLTSLLAHYSSVIFNKKHLHDIEKVEVLLGGDHGKGAFSFLAIIIVRFKTFKSPIILDLQIGQIDSTEDKMNMLKPLLDMIQLDIKKMYPTSNGCIKVCVVKEGDNKIQLVWR